MSTKSTSAVATAADPDVSQGDGSPEPEARALPAIASTPGTLQLQSMDDVVRLGRVLYESGYFKDVQGIAQAIVKVLAGAEIGIPPIAAMRGVHAFDGGTSLHYAVVGAQIKRSGRYDYRVIEASDERCELEFFERGKAVGRASFALEEARGIIVRGKPLADKDNWRNYSGDMCFGRAITRGARRYCPDVFNGPVYTPEEIGYDEAVVVSESPANGGAAADNPPAGDKGGSAKASGGARKKAGKNDSASKDDSAGPDDVTDYKKKIQQTSSWLDSRAVPDFLSSVDRAKSAVAAWPATWKKTAENSIRDHVEIHEQRKKLMEAMVRAIYEAAQLGEAALDDAVTEWDHKLRGLPGPWKTYAIDLWNETVEMALAALEDRGVDEKQGEGEEDDFGLPGWMKEEAEGEPEPTPAKGRKSSKSTDTGLTPGEQSEMLLSGGRRKAPKP